MRGLARHAAGYLSGMTSPTRPDINGPTTAAQEAAKNPAGLPEQAAAPRDVAERLRAYPRDDGSLTDQPGHDVDSGLQEEL